ncbi:hypothetical protein M9H77_03131 [Catharanthus roseus]|uniref:Uncharacterized protein n=1 Tax=Catharanthus roseus TaxID=4058 RepID=A0ACC0CAT2_CATRO|nr:hypothetical protein M9H77_03131 [Catharanthus roseus]
MIEEFSKVNELPQATVQVEEGVVIHVKEEIYNVEHCDLMREKNIEKKRIEINEKERVEEKERLVERLDSNKDEEGKLDYKLIKTINFLPSNSYLSFEIYFKEIKLFSLVFMENGYEFYFLNTSGTLLEKNIS